MIHKQSTRCGWYFKPGFYNIDYITEAKTFSKQGGFAGEATARPPDLAIYCGRRPLDLGSDGGGRPLWTAALPLPGCSRSLRLWCGIKRGILGSGNARGVVEVTDS